ncbi:MAG: glutamine--fructose-6-phosphate transaminase (isomerizing) [Candidatus Firestonebacteria bacterium]|nr:glutamine--fructose-6-phosphate transaminase (isomerizing) [Candidatus Firestonebacteria bacterium]
MCGIIGYIGDKPAVPILIEGLKRLEYRGYDSAGIAVIEKNKLILWRNEGKISELEKKISGNKSLSTIGIGHTRWATHGKPSEENAHPHIDCKNNIVIVHNGIIENYIQLKNQLIKEGHKFKSETDTEIIAHLIEKYYTGKNLEKAVQRITSKIKGAYALGVISSCEPDKIIAIKNKSPMVIGIGKGESFIASDIPAILNYTRKVIYLDDGEFAVLTKDKVTVYNSNTSKPVSKKIDEITWDPLMAEKSGYRHFMLKEIFEQPRVVEDTMRGRLIDDKEINLPEIKIKNEHFRKIKKIFILACGTSYHAGMVGKYIIEDCLRIPVEVDIASEFRYRDPIMDKSDLVIAISQSGETADTLAAVHLAKQKEAKVISICNVVGSTLSRETEGVIYTHAGPEIGVASTKAFTSQLIAIYIFTLFFGKTTQRVSSDFIRKIIIELRKIPNYMEDILIKLEKDIQKTARQYFNFTNFLYLGRGISSPIALEGALKLKEISYIHAEGYPAGEMKHGPIALIDEKMPVVVIAPVGKVNEKILSNIEEVKARDGIVITITDKTNKEIISKSDVVFIIPKTMEIISPVLTIVPLQLFAYYIAVRRGCDVDQPRNLAKSVTVE